MVGLLLLDVRDHETKVGHKTVVKSEVRAQHLGDLKENTGNVKNCSLQISIFQ
jgi:transcription elongation GreA/GreB family factor